MKRFITLILGICLLLSCTFITSAGASPEKIAANKSKISEELTKMLESSDDSEFSVKVTMKDIDSTKVMQTFAKRYPIEYNAYIEACNSNFEGLPICEGDIKLKDGPDDIKNKYDSEHANLLQKGIELKRSIYKEFYEKSNKSLIDQYCAKDKQTYVCSYIPLAIVKVKKSTIDNLINNDSILSIDMVTDRKVETSNLHLANSISRADYVRDTYLNTGSGVKIGQMEPAVPDESDPDLLGATIYINEDNPGSTIEENIIHATHVAKIMVGQADGLAPDAVLYSTGWEYESEFYSSIDWLVQQGVNVINISAGIETGDGSYDDLSKWLDHVAVNHDIHVVVAAGNTGDQVIIPAMAYNAITVGGYYDYNTLDHSDDIWTNIPWAFVSYQESSVVPRPEKPNLVASAVNIWTTPDPYFNCGTSWAAPQVAGTIAQLCSYDTALKLKQSAMGALLAASSARKVQDVTGYGNAGSDSFATVYRIEGNTQISEREGAGKLDSRYARGIAYYDHYWSYTLTSFPYSKTVSINTSENSYIRVAIFWLKRIDGNGEEISQFTNLNLTVLNPSGVSVGTSTTTYSNFEIVQFHPTVSGTYTIRITKSGTNNSTQEHVGIAVW